MQIMFEGLSQRLEQAFRSLKGKGRITEINIAMTLKEIRRALVSADVHYRIAKDLTAQIKEKAMGRAVLHSVSPQQLFIKITEEALARLMGEDSRSLSLDKKPSTILLSGLQGSGKTTFCAKLGLWLKKKGYTVLLVGADVYRPAAKEQLRILSEKANVAYYTDMEETNAALLAKKGLSLAQQKGYRVVIVDTAGRTAVDKAMMSSLVEIKSVLEPQNILFVADAMTGQDASETVQAFASHVDIDGIVLTKMDSDTRGGAALTLRATTNKPIMFVSHGEHISEMSLFHPDRIARRILGMGDVASLVEKAQENYDEEKARKLAKKVRKNLFTLDDFVDQIEQLRKMGGLKAISKLLPGMGKHADLLEEKEMELDIPRIVVSAMTPKERTKPELIDMSRKRRIAAGSGRSIEEVNHTLKRYTMVRKNMKSAMTKKGKGFQQSLQALMEKGS